MANGDFIFIDSSGMVKKEFEAACLRALEHCGLTQFCGKEKNLLRSCVYIGGRNKRTD